VSGKPLVSEVLVYSRKMLTPTGALGIPVNPWFQKHLGLPGFLHEYKWLDTKLSDNVENAFQALALDEHRAPFSPAVWEKPEGCQTVSQHQYSQVLANFTTVSETDMVPGSTFEYWRFI
jgi:hypothetical protein